MKILIIISMMFLFSKTYAANSNFDCFHALERVYDVNTNAHKSPIFRAAIDPVSPFILNSSNKKSLSITKLDQKGNTLVITKDGTTRVSSITGSCEPLNAERNIHTEIEDMIYSGKDSLYNTIGKSRPGVSAARISKVLEQCSGLSPRLDTAIIRYKTQHFGYKPKSYLDDGLN